MATRSAHRRVVTLAVVLQLIVTLLGLSAPATAASVRGVLGDRSIALADVTRYHCHDAAHPVIRCFESARQAKLAFLAALGTGRPEASAPLEVLAITYIRVFVHTNYQGSSIYLSQDYEDLGSIGWNDVISSYRPMNSQSGTMYEHVLRGGRIKNFCCNANVSNIGDWMNDRTSAIES
jgi:hypothetical protein